MICRSRPLCRSIRSEIVVFLAMICGNDASARVAFWQRCLIGPWCLRVIGILMRDSYRFFFASRFMHGPTPVGCANHPLP